MIGLPGVGQIVGSTIGGLIGGASDTKKMIRDYDKIQRRKYSKLDLAANVNPYGSDNTFYMKKGGVAFMEDGGLDFNGILQGVGGMLNDISGVGAVSNTIAAMKEAPIMESGGSGKGAVPVSNTDNRVMVNIEKGEILIDPISLEVVREYNNENRYKPHSKNPEDEALGNFTMIDQGHVVIPKEYASRYVNGDRLVRKSIIAEILKNQANNPQQNAPRAGAPFAKKGYTPGIWPDDGNSPYAPGDAEYVSPIDVISALDDPISYLSAVHTHPADPRKPRVGPEMAAGFDFSKTGKDGGGEEDPPPGTNFRLKAAQALPFFASAYGITNALGIDPFLKYDENTQMDAAKAYIEGMETNPNIEASKAAIRRQNANRNKMLQNFNSPSTRAEVAAGNVDVLAAEGNLIQNAVNTATEMRNKKRETLARLEESQGANRLNMRQSLMNELRQDKANRENLVHSGISEISQNYQTQVMDMERIKALNTLGEFYKLDPYSSNLLIDDGVFLNKVMETLGRLKGGVSQGAAGVPALPTASSKKPASKSNKKSGKS